MKSLTWWGVLGVIRECHLVIIIPVWGTRVVTRLLWTWISSHLACQSSLNSFMKYVEIFISFQNLFGYDSKMIHCPQTQNMFYNRVTVPGSTN